MAELLGRAAALAVLFSAWLLVVLVLRARLWRDRLPQDRP